MTPTNRTLLLAALLAGACRAPMQGAAPTPEIPAQVPAARTWDVVIYGGTSAAVTAAVQLRRMGRTVVVLEPGQHLGGLTSGGLGATDIGRKTAIGGLARTFYERVHQHYDDAAAWKTETREQYLARSPSNRSPDTVADAKGVRAMWTFEPSVAEGILRRMVAEAGATVEYGQRLDLRGGVRKSGARIEAIRMESGKTYEARVFIDATYEGDLMAKAGVSYHVGREANAVYGETLNGVQTARATKHQFGKRVDPYVVPGDPASGLLPGVSAEPPGVEGAGDHRVQAYNFRMTMTDVPANQVPVPKPADYDPRRYELLRRYIAAGHFDALGSNIAMPNRKTDINNNGAFSSDHIGANYAYPDADHQTRERIFQDHVSYVMGMWWFLQNDPELPADVRTRAGRWALCKDEFQASGHWPHQMYVREARRMIGATVMTEHHCRGTVVAEDSVGLGAYNMDSHNTQRYVKDGAAINEGDIQVAVAGQYAIAYGAIVPKRAEAENLLVPVALSASHIAYGSIRMEPVFMVLGQSAATAAAMAVEDGKAVQEVDYGRLRERLLADGQILK